MEDVAVGRDYTAEARVAGSKTEVILLAVALGKGICVEMTNGLKDIPHHAKTEAVDQIDLYGLATRTRFRNVIHVIHGESRW
jgi:hypothetical protein